MEVIRVDAEAGDGGVVELVVDFNGMVGMENRLGTLVFIYCIPQCCPELLDVIVCGIGQSCSSEGIGISVYVGAEDGSLPVLGQAEEFEEEVFLAVQTVRLYNWCCRSVSAELC